MGGLLSPMPPVNRVVELERKVRELTVFHEIGKAITSTLDLSRVLETIMEQISTLFHPDTWSLLLMDLEKHELYFEIAVGDASEKLKQIRIKMGEGIAGWVAQEGKPVFIAACLPVCGSSTTNSSPPYRNAKSIIRKWSRMSCPTCASSLLPCRWPCVSFTCLKWSRSRNTSENS